jgi:hypothetical protein
VSDIVRPIDAEALKETLKKDRGWRLDYVTKECLNAVINAAPTLPEFTNADLQSRYDALQATVSEATLVKLVKSLWANDPEFSNQDVTGAQKLIKAILSDRINITTDLEDES